MEGQSYSWHSSVLLQLVSNSGSVPMGADLDSVRQLSDSGRIAPMNFLEVSFAMSSAEYLDLTSCSYSLLKGQGPSNAVFFQDCAGHT